MDVDVSAFRHSSRFFRVAVCSPFTEFSVHQPVLWPVLWTRSWLCFYTREVSHNLSFLTMRGAQRFCVEFSRKPSKVEVLLYLHSHMARGNTSGRIVQVPSNRMVVRNDFFGFWGNLVSASSI